MAEVDIMSCSTVVFLQEMLTGFKKRKIKEKTGSVTLIVLLKILIKLYPEVVYHCNRFLQKGEITALDWCIYSFLPGRRMIPYIVCFKV